MGMFDTVFIGAKASSLLPAPYSDGLCQNWQTKGLINGLSDFQLVKNQNNCLELHYKSRWLDKTQLYPFTGTFEIHGWDNVSTRQIRLWITVDRGIVSAISTEEKPSEEALIDLIRQDNEYNKIFNNELSSIRTYLKSKYGITIAVFSGPSESEKLFELEKRKCLTPELEWMFDRK